MEWLHIFNEWLAAHPGWAWAAVFAIACGESLALVGLLLPGTLLMFAIGALVGMGTLPFAEAAAWAALGAVVGDGISFWLGRHYRQELRVRWPFSRHPQLIERSAEYFRRHGGKSILFARFVGPIRPVLPAVAGMMEMPAGRFFTVNVLSALLWAPLYLLPGVVFAASLDLAAEAAGRLALALLLLLLLLFLLGWSARWLFLYLHPRAFPLMQRLLAWSRLHPRLGELPAALLDPNHPEARGMSLWAVLLLAATIAFSLLLRALHHGGLLPNLDHYLAQQLPALRSPLMDRWMGVLDTLFAVETLWALLITMALYLLLRSRLHALLHWLAAAGFALLAGRLLLELGVDTLTLLPGLSLYGFLAVLIARELTPERAWLAYALFAVLLGAALMTPLYLGQITLSALLTATTLALAWVALLGIAYRRHNREPSGPLMPALLGLTALLVSGLIQPPTTPMPPPHSQLSLETTWATGGWRQLPAWRDDLRALHAHPLNLHYHGELALLERALGAQGWRRPLNLADGGWLRWLSSAPAIELPVVPQVHAGRNESLLLIRQGRDEEELWVLRLWASGVKKVWIGNLGTLKVRTLPGLRVLRSAGQFDAAQQRFAPLEGFTLRREQHPQGSALLLLEAN